MKATNHMWEEKEDLKNYLTQINWDAFFLKAQLIMSGIFVVAFMVYIVWVG
ncbi:MAG: hypothetical protein R3209_11210 [Salinimicrobium sediminis]|uniref:Uncharacterized protein n=1 Tax=Salinimicrobium sediminis TaxID=1343891 RepID=A0A285X8F1_9FLAO|nr:hypothetical protein [Salinimicrobium sediminis]MDX1603633.1 hypothetical protein [Salinimicrobium sediminis]MDX1752283.1 hypothetical protein [Salinimicrobium sediminis]SOC81064.1 hypothetical protein SAMN06296241_2636 [Salinimicrobium sediminis]